MKFIKIGKKKFKLASRMKRLYAFFIDLMLLGTAVSGSLLFLIMLDTFRVVQIGYPVDMLWVLCSIALCGFGLFFIDGFRSGQGIGKKLLSLQVIRLKDGKPCTFKDAFLRRFAGVFQPLDFFWLFGSKRQRLGDAFAETVVVELDPALELTETEETEGVLETVIDELKSKLSEACRKVEASIGVEKQFQDAYEGAVMQVERWQERAVVNLKVGREDLAREALEKRNECKRLAEKYRTQSEEQKRIVRTLRDLFEHLQRQLMEIETKKTVVVAQHRNVDAEAHLREILKEVQDNKAFETLTKMEQEAIEATTLAKAAAEIDVAYQDAKLEREFVSYAEESSIDEDIAELKAKLL